MDINNIVLIDTDCDDEEYIRTTEVADNDSQFRGGVEVPPLRVQGRAI